MARKRKPQRQPPPKDRSQTTSARRERRERAREQSRATRRERLLLFAVLALTALAFANALDGQFVYDDRFQILKNPTLTSLSNIPRMFTQGVWQFLNEGDKAAVGPYYRPIFNIALIISSRLFGLEVFGWHLFSIALHLLVVFLVYRLARQWRLSFEVAAGSALLFGLHPIHSESIAWVAALPDPLASVFVLSSLLLYERRYHDKVSNIGVLSASLVLALAAMLSKEVAVILPFFLVARELLDREGKNLVELAARTAKRTAPFFAAIVIYLGMRYYVLGFLGKDEPGSLGIPALQVLLTIPSILLSYARMLLVPYPLAVVYDNRYVTSAADWRFWGPALMVVAMLGGVVWLVRSSITGRRALAFMIVFILPVLNLKAFRQEESLLHDRYLYLPSVGFCILVAMSFDWLSARFAARKEKVFAAATLVTGGVLLGLTFYQNFSWQNELAMIDNAQKSAPRWPFLHNYVGAWYAEQQRLPEAERDYLAALDIDPKYYDALSNLGDVYRQQGKLDDAERCYLNAISYGAPYADTYYNLGVTYISMGRLADAEQPLRRAVEVSPSNVNARYNLAWDYERQGKDALAEAAYAETLQRAPDYPEPRINLGILLTKNGRYDEAFTQLRAAQQYAPDHPVLLYALADASMKTGRYEDALAQFKLVNSRGLHQNLVHTNLGLCYENLGRKEEAKAEFQKAIDSAPQDPYTNTAREHLAKMQGGT